MPPLLLLLNPLNPAAVVLLLLHPAPPADEVGLKVLGLAAAVEFTALVPDADAAAELCIPGLLAFELTPVPTPGGLLPKPPGPLLVLLLLKADDLALPLLMLPVGSVSGL